jgi:hypothetical protein
MNAASFDEFGRMTANIGVEAVPATPAAQNVTLYPYVNPQTELIDGTNLPQGDVSVKPISSASDGTQVWKITHNGVDTHPIHFHLYDVQLLNRVTWDNIIIPPEASELGWKDTVRVSPLEDTIVALRPIVPTLPFEIPNSIRNLNPMMPTGDQSAFNDVDPNGNPTANITNQLVNFGWEYVWHCHILSHEEMDMMRPESLVLPPTKADQLAVTLVSMAKGNKTGTVRVSWIDNSIAETGYVLQRMNGTGTWVDIGTLSPPLSTTNTKGATLSLTDSTWTPTGTYQYRVVALNTVGYGAEFPSMTAKSFSDAVAGVPAPTGLTATAQSATRVNLSWTDNSSNETGFVVQRAVDGGAFALFSTMPLHSGTGTMTLADTTVSVGHDYAYRVAALVAGGQTAWSNTASVSLKVPAAPVINTATAARQANGEVITVTFNSVTGATGYILQWSNTSAFTTVAGSVTVGNVTTANTTRIARQGWYVRLIATNIAGQSAPSAPPVQVASA